MTSARGLAILIAVSMLPAVPASAGPLQARTAKAWDTYVAATEARIAGELASTGGFLASDPSRCERVVAAGFRRDEAKALVVIEEFYGSGDHIGHPLSHV